MTERMASGSEPSKGTETRVAVDFDGVLVEVIAQFGRRIVDRPDRLRAALADSLASTATSAEDENALRARIDAVVAASASGVASSIRDGDPEVAATAEQIQGWFDDLVRAGVSLRDAALAARSWAMVFDASATAQRTEEISEELGAAPSSGSRGVGDSATSLEADDARLLGETVLGPDSDASRTIGVEASIIAHSPAPTAEPPTPAEVAPVMAPPTATGYATMPPPTGQRFEQSPPSPSLVERLGWTLNRMMPKSPIAWLAAIGVCVVVLAAAITVPIVLTATAGGGGDDDQSGADGPDSGTETALYTQDDLAGFVLGEERLRELASAEPDLDPPSDWGLATVFPADTVITDEHCAPLLWYSPGQIVDDEGETVGGPIYGGYAWGGQSGSVTSYARIFPSIEAAASALHALAPEDCLGSQEVSYSGTPQQATVVGEFTALDESEAEITTTAFEFEDRVEQRTCGRDRNLVVCHWRMSPELSSADGEMWVEISNAIDAARAE